MVVVKLRKSFLQIIGITLSIFCMFKFPHSVSVGVTEGLQICFSVILPSLFPFMVISTYIIKSNVFSFTYKFLAPISWILFRQSANTIPVIIMSMIGGFPVGIKMTNNLLESRAITFNQAQRLCIFCMNGGPAFIITAIGVNMLGSTKAGVIIFVSLCISSLILGFLTRFLSDKSQINETIETQSSLSSLSASVSDALQSVLGICAWIVIFSAFTNCLKEIIHNKTIFNTCAAIVEVTKGCILFAGKTPIPIITALIGFGGLCVHFQVMGSLKNCKVKYSHFLVCRIANGALGAFISYLLLLIFPVDIDVFASMQNVSVSAFSVSLPAFFTFAIMCIIMIFDIDRKKKVW